MKHIFTLVAALLFCAQAATAQQNLDTKAKLLAGGKSVMAGMCKEHQQSAKTATSIGTIRLADQSVELWCSCAPAEMERVVADLSEPISRETALNTFTQATSICTGKQMRASAIAACLTDDEAARSGNVGTYCACVGSRLSALTDEQLYKELNEAYSKEALESKTSGKALPFMESFALRKYGAGCETAQVTKLK